MFWEESIAGDNCFSIVVITEGVPTKFSRVAVGQVPLYLLCCRGIYHVTGGDKYQIAILIVTHHRLCTENNYTKPLS